MVIADVMFMGERIVQDAGGREASREVQKGQSGFGEKAWRQRDHMIVFVSSMGKK